MCLVSGYVSTICLCTSPDFDCFTIVRVPDMDGRMTLKDETVTGMTFLLLLISMFIFEKRHSKTVFFSWNVAFADLVMACSFHPPLIAWLVARYVSRHVCASVWP